MTTTATGILVFTQSSDKPTASVMVDLAGGVDADGVGQVGVLRQGPEGGGHVAAFLPMGQVWDGGVHAGASGSGHVPLAMAVRVRVNFIVRLQGVIQRATALSRAFSRGAGVPSEGV